ncbi:MAG TPA: lysine--tRNA ligase [Candidatus Nanoarchaeia archaeon]|nr:lysine--tRNA ligase [Candidatus Nanoarchaeia archaeon]
MEAENQLIAQRLEKLKALYEKGINPYPYKFEQKNHAIEILEKFKKLKKEEHTQSKVAVAGRIMTLRPMGKAGFLHIQDDSGQIQAYVREDKIGKDNYEIFRKLDLGDIIGVNGKVFRTKMGEITVEAANIELLCKSLRPLPEKWHGLKDIEARYRQRYLDLIVNPEVKNVFIKRFKIINSLRNSLNEKGYIEVDTPVLQPMYGGANARPFKSHLHDLKMEVYLRISNELYLKRLLVGGFEKVYEIARDFRNESIDSTHNPEFSMIEIYQAYSDYKDIMELTQEIILKALKNIQKGTKVNYRGSEIDFKLPWEKMTMKDAVKKYGKIDVDRLSKTEFLKLKEKYKLDVDDHASKGLWTQALFEELVEPNLIQPTFIIEHPKETTPLCKVSKNDKELIERVELFIGGMEMANGYSELNDPLKQKELLEEQAGKLRKGDEDAHPMDEDFIKTLEHGMPPTGGVGIGIDRLVMLLTGSESIKDVILFPFMK